MGPAFCFCSPCGEKSIDGIPKFDKVRNMTATTNRIKGTKRNALGRGLGEIQAATKSIRTAKLVSIVAIPVFESSIRRRFRGVQAQPIAVDWSKVPAYWNPPRGSGIPVKPLAEMPKRGLIATFLRNIKRR